MEDRTPLTHTQRTSAGYTTNGCGILHRWRGDSRRCRPTLRRNCGIIREGPYRWGPIRPSCARESVTMGRTFQRKGVVPTPHRVAVNHAEVSLAMVSNYTVGGVTQASGLSHTDSICADVAVITFLVRQTTFEDILVHATVNRITGVCSTDIVVVAIQFRTASADTTVLALVVRSASIPVIAGIVVGGENTGTIYTSVGGANVGVVAIDVIKTLNVIDAYSAFADHIRTTNLIVAVRVLTVHETVRILVQSAFAERLS